MARDVPLFNREDLVTNRQLPPLGSLPQVGTVTAAPITQSQAPSGMFSRIKAALAPPIQEAPQEPANASNGELGVEASPPRMPESTDQKRKGI